MHIDQLRNLVLIHRIGSINKASEQAHMSQQALNTSMKKLEAEVGCSLLMRHSRGVYLSENGLLLEKTAEEILQKLDETLEQLKVIKPSTPLGNIWSYFFLQQSVILSFQNSQNFFHNDTIPPNSCLWKKRPTTSFN